MNEEKIRYRCSACHQLIDGDKCHEINLATRGLVHLVDLSVCRNCTGKIGIHSHIFWFVVLALLDHVGQCLKVVASELIRGVYYRVFGVPEGSEDV